METLHTILTWYFHHPSGRKLEDLIDAYWEIVSHEPDLTKEQLVELFFIAAEISTINLTEGLFLLGDFEETFNNNALSVSRDDLISTINQQMEAKRSQYVQEC